MVKVSRKDTKNLAAEAIRDIKTKHPELSNKDVRAILSTGYSMLKEQKEA